MLVQNETNSMKDSVVSTNSVQVRKEAHRVVSGNVTCPYLSNSKANQFFDILLLLDDLSSLHSGSDFHIGKGVKDRAVSLLCLLGGAEQLELPKVLPEGEECLSLTWDRHPWKTFVTIYPDEVEGTTYNRVSGIRCTAPLSADDASIDPKRIFEALAVVPKPNTVDIR